MALKRVVRRVDAGGASLLPHGTPGGAPTQPLSIGTTRPGDLNWLTRLAWIAVIAIGVALAFGALVSAIEALGRLSQS